MSGKVCRVLAATAASEHIFSRSESKDICGSELLVQVYIPYTASSLVHKDSEMATKFASTRATTLIIRIKQ